MSASSGFFGSAALRAVAAVGLLSLGGCARPAPPSTATSPTTSLPPAQTQLAAAPTEVLPFDDLPPLPAPATPAAVIERDPAAADQQNATNRHANAWALAPKRIDLPAGARAYVLTRGREHSYDDGDAIYHLYAYDVAETKGTKVTLRDIGGGTFVVGGAFVLPAGLADDESVGKGDSVLAEWASSLKHATVTGLQGDRVVIRYTDLPETWSGDKAVAVKSRRQLTLQREGLHPGNYASAKIDGSEQLVLLVSEQQDGWLVQRFAGRVSVVATADLGAIPLRPKLTRGRRVLAPWVGTMYAGKVVSVEAGHVRVRIEGIGRDEPVVVAIGQVRPVPASAGK